jgi:hypothetical protein
LKLGSALKSFQFASNLQLTFSVSLQVFFLALASSTLAEPPSPSYGLPSISSTYGLPEISTGYNYKPQVISTGYDYKPSIVSTEYIQKDPGRIPSEGYNLDPQLLNKIRHILIDHENSGSIKIVSKPSSSYGVPQSTYGPPQGWTQSSRVVGLDFGHLSQSIPVAYYVGTDRYASNHGGSGWSAGNSGWSSGNIVSSGWSSSNTGSSGWKTSPPVITLKPQPPAISYGVPSRW